MAIGGALLKSIQTLLYAILFCCAGIILGVYSYFLSVLADRDITIPKENQAIEGISGAAVLYLIFAVLLTCFLGGKTFFALLGIILDILFAGGFVAIAVLTRDGAKSCSGIVNTPFGRGPANSKEGFGDQVTYAVSFGTACRLNSACFAVAIVGAILFLVSALVQLALGRHHKKEKRFGPGPRNNYTRGSGMKFWQRKRRNQALRDPEVGTVPATGAGVTGNHIRPSHDTAYTGSTVAAPNTYDSHKPLSGGYHTAPTGTYGNTQRTAATNY